MKSKSEIRSQIRQARDHWQQKSPAEFAAASHHICNRLLGLSDVIEAKTWFVYVSTASEVATHELLRTLLDRRYTVAVPLNDRRRSDDRPSNSFARRTAPWKCAAFWNRPVGEPLHGRIDVCVCPGLAFSEHCDRLGWGPGYYDRFLATQQVGLSIGLSFECQIVSEIPHEWYDRRMDLVITEKRVIRRV